MDAAITSMLTDAIGQVTPVVLGVTGGLVGLAVTWFAAKWILKVAGKGGKA